MEAARRPADDGPAPPPGTDGSFESLRIKTAGELHDGVLQALTAASLQLEVVRRTMRADPDGAERILLDLMENVQAEQRELRLFVDELKGPHSAWSDGALPVHERLEDMLQRIQTIWGIQVTLSAARLAGLPPRLDREVIRLVQEAVVNAARHGHASNVSLRLEVRSGAVHIHLRDNGLGFSFQGEYHGDELKARRMGPVSLRRRVEMNDGTLVIRSTERGARIHIAIPLHPGDHSA
ncbi:MAG: histidine kinase [Gemmatimonadota bacterium]